ncbi:hypothetical protein [Glycomyces paridis]|uniref:Uncharacterized protein n=1 Tax=Glycomyces paridis TaxID=2126555 RepID=A0A4S8PEN0_9ACTN|nr:hypothetical protein [Glycomyces paridis]THV26794.1 hypothetical protein E9998_17570 [Glycomyces paridis]
MPQRVLDPACLEAYRDEIVARFNLPRSSGCSPRAGAAQKGSGSIGRSAAGAEEEEEATTATWLTEDEDVWGTARFEDPNDPH